MLSNGLAGKDGVYFMVRNRLSGKGLSSLTEGRLKRERTPASEVWQAWSHPSLGFRYRCSIPADRVVLLQQDKSYESTGWHGPHSIFMNFPANDLAAVDVFDKV